MVIWDYAVAAIALAVKMHRDVYPPLKPIFACHFLTMTHHEMSPEDLELDQRNLFEYFSYDLSMPTPQEYLDELRLALPTLQDALGSEHTWKDVLNETWKQLFAAVPWPDMLRFPVSLLTATALIEAITRVVCRRLSVMRMTTRAEHLERIGDWRVNHGDTIPGAGVSTPEITSVHEPADAELNMLRATTTVFEDIREILGLSEVWTTLLVLFLTS
ncbi:hypothetical protein BC827DRAFT_1140235 [Russula dissimulans]|nr:hypothetical protein BC827DRAFT_1140235 [Russula dissimulans]